MTVANELIHHVNLLWSVEIEKTDNEGIDGAVIKW
jgi:hypothetical protein